MSVFGTFEAHSRKNRGSTWFFIVTASCALSCVFFNFFTVFSFSMYYISVFVCISPLLNCVNVKKVRKNKIILDNVVWIYQIVYKKNLPLNLLRVFFVVIINTSFLTQSYICVWFVFNYFFVVYACVFRLLLYCWAWIWKAAAPKVVLFSHVI